MKNVTDILKNIVRNVQAGVNSYQTLQPSLQQSVDTEPVPFDTDDSGVTTVDDVILHLEEIATDLAQQVTTFINKRTAPGLVYEITVSHKIDQTKASVLPTDTLDTFYYFRFLFKNTLSAINLAWVDIPSQSIAQRPHDDSELDFNADVRIFT